MHTRWMVSLFSVCVKVAVLFKLDLVLDQTYSDTETIQKVGSCVFGVIQVCDKRLALSK